MHAITRAILLNAARAALQQNVSGNLAAHVQAKFEVGTLGLVANQKSVVEHELKVLGLLGSGNGGYLS